MKIGIIKKTGQYLGLLLIPLLLIGHGGAIPHADEYQCESYLWIESNSKCTTGDKISQLQGKTKIDGNLVIYGAMTSDLSSLSELQTIKRDLVIRGTTGLVNLHGLEKLQSIGGKIIIQYNGDLKSLSGLSLPEQLKGFDVQSNDQLHDLKAAETLKVINGDLTISNNISLSSINDFKSLESVSGSITLNSLATQTDLYELRKIKKLGGSLTLSEMPLLIKLNGLESLEEVTGVVTISNNGLLLAIDMLLSLVKTNQIFITNNPEVRLISFNDNLKLSQLEIVGNKQLASLLGANNLAEIAILKIEGSPALGSISGFYGLTKVWSILLTELDLSDLAILNQLTSVGVIQLDRLPKLIKLPEMPLLNEIGRLDLQNLPELTDFGSSGKIRIINNLYLKNISKLVNLSSAEGVSAQNLVVSDNPELASFTGLSIDENGIDPIVCRLENNPKLVDINIVSKYKKISLLSIVNNALLTTLPFDQLSIVDFDLEIKNNSSLCESTVDDFLVRLKNSHGVPPNVFIEGNKSCN